MIRETVQRYLLHLRDRYRYLEFKGMGVTDQVPLRLALLDLYVPLKARLQLPMGEAWPRDLYLAGRERAQGEAASVLTNSVPMLDLLGNHDGVVILGDPGAGKTTFLKYLVLMLAMGEGGRLGLGARLPVLFPLSAYANALVSKDVPLDRFIADYYRERGMDLPFEKVVSASLARGTGLLLLDGLDEVHDLAHRHVVVQAVTDFFTFHRRSGNKFIITSRIVGYRDVRPAAEGLVECTLVDFDDDEIVEFVERWTAALERAARGDTEVAAHEMSRERKELLDSVYRSEGVRRLATNPLLLTILALMKRQGAVLPERRVELYQKAVETLLKHWNIARGLGRPPGHVLDVIELVRVLAPLALWMHMTSRDGLVKGEAMRRMLTEICVDRGVAEPEQTAQEALADAREYAGLLLERGTNEYGFIHLTFQEYLAAVAIARTGQQDVRRVTDELAEHIAEDAWREVILLTIGYIGIVQQRDEAAGAILEELIGRDLGVPGQTAELAGSAVLDAWPGGVTPDCKERIVGHLLRILTDYDRVAPSVRVACGRVLAGLGDPREEAVTIEAMQFCLVPGGPFLMGAGEEEHLNPCIQHPFWMSRFPVTVRQFESFAAAGGYSEPWCWTEVGRRWRIEADINGPPVIGEAFRLSSHPAVAVTWHEAVAFTRWLTKKLREENVLTEGWKVRLPTEAEWEKAARGGLRVLAEPIILPLYSAAPFPPPAEAYASAALAANPASRRAYPWGGSFDPNHAASNASSVDTTSCVGCFPNGASPYGVEDMSGNVWEWLLNVWGTDWEKAEFGYPYNPEDGRECIEASDEVLRMVRGGSYLDDAKHLMCSYRTRNGPDVRHLNHGFRVCIAPTEAASANDASRVSNDVDSYLKEGRAPW